VKNNKKKLNILVFTQKVDKNDDVLGAFYYWWEKLAVRANNLNIVCLYEGEHRLPSNVKVFSLGKNNICHPEGTDVCHPEGTDVCHPEGTPEGSRSRSKRFFACWLRMTKHRCVIQSRFRYIWRVLRYFWALRKTTDIIFVHMNEVYIFLLWPLAKIYKIPIIFWKAHGGKLPHIKKAIFMSDKIVTSGEKTFGYNTPKKIIIGQGVNTDFFQGQAPKESAVFEVLAVGRPSAVKHYDILIQAADILINQRNKKNFVFKIVGSPQTNKERENQKMLEDKISFYNLNDYFTMEGGVAFREIREKYQKCSCLVNLTYPASLEKVVLEAMAMEKPVLVSNEAFFPFFDGLDFLKVKLNDPTGLADKIEGLAGLPLFERMSVGKKLREIIVKNHSLDRFIANLTQVFYESIKG